VNRDAGVMPERKRAIAQDAGEAAKSRRVFHIAIEVVRVLSFPFPAR